MVSTPEKTQSFAAMLSDVDALVAAINMAHEDGDLESAETAQAFIDGYLLPTIEQKADALAFVINEKLPGEAQFRKEYLRQIEAWAKQPEDQIKSLKELLKFLYESGRLENVLTEDNKLLGVYHQLSFSKLEKPAIDVDEDAIERLWTDQERKYFADVKVIVKPLKAALANQVAEGKPIPPGVTYRYPTRLTIGTRKDSKKKK